MQHNDNPMDSLRDAWDNSQDLAALWNNMEAAPELEPLPTGQYACIVYGGEMTHSRQKGTPGYSVTFEVIAGQHTGRKVEHSIWITPKAIPLAKRDLGKLGIASLDDLDKPLPRPVNCRARIGQRTMDDGRVFNSVQAFTVTEGGDPPPAPAQAPASPPEAHGHPEAPTPTTPAPAALYDDAFPPKAED